MDDWGDPWADDTGKQSPTKEVLSPHRSLAVQPVVAGFSDEAQWGTWADEESFGGWAGYEGVEEGKQTGKNQVVKEAIESPVLKAQEPSEPTSLGTLPAELGDDGWTGTDNAENAADTIPMEFTRAADASAEPPEETSAQRGPAVSGPGLSSSPTTVIPTSPREEKAKETSDDGPPPPDGDIEDDVSTRPSTSPSEVSQKEAAVDSPRTSFEDDHRIVKDREDQAVATPAGHIAAEAVPSGEDDDFGDFESEGDEEQTDNEDSQDTLEQFAEESGTKGTLSSAVFTEKEVVHGTEHLISTASFPPDLSLIKQLFPLPEVSENLSTSEDTPIYSTSARKAWYRLTRNETLREFNSGNDDDSYVRIAWPGSHIRTEINKIVSRWASEDRVNGRAILGGTPSAVFNWDSPASSVFPESPRSHRRKRSSLTSTTSHAKPESPVETKFPTIPKAGPVAQFGWNSTSATAASIPLDASEKDNPWGLPEPPTPPIQPLPVSTPLTLSRGLKSQERPVSMDFSRVKHVHLAHKRAQSTSSPLARSETPSISTVMNGPAVNQTLQASVVDKSPIQLEAAPVSSVRSVSSPTPVMTRDFDPWDSLSRLDTTPKAPAPIVTAPEEDDDDDWGEMVQSPVTPAPASAPFGFPTSALSPQQTAAFSFPISSVATPPLGTPVSVSQPFPPTSIPTITNPSTPDPYATADFSIFEDAPKPTPISTPIFKSLVTPHHRAHPSLPPSFRQQPKIPARRSSLRATSGPPTIQFSRPVAAVSQKIKPKITEEDEILQSIIAGLPDLTYMLR